MKNNNIKENIWEWHKETEECWKRDVIDKDNSRHEKRGKPDWKEVENLSGWFK